MNSFGRLFRISIFGESHGEAVGVTLDGVPAGLELDETSFEKDLGRRKSGKRGTTPRKESDTPHLLTGVFNGRTTGAPLTILFHNENTLSGDYKNLITHPRPSHSDWVAIQKFRGFADYRGGGHFSGRVTAPLVAAGAILLTVLRAAGVAVGTHILRCGEAWDRPFADAAADIAALGEAAFPALDPASGEAISREILAARDAHDSVGGITQTAVCGLPAGVGEPWFDSVESVLSHAVFSVGGVKGIEFGSGFSAAGQRGSQFNDPLRMQAGCVVTATNHNGGINGGISNGMPVVFQCAVKPTPSIAQPQQTVDFLRGEDAELTIRGRHDPAIIRRICPVLDSVTALALCDLLAQRFGTDYFTKGVQA